jgi:hypothetical protein
VRCDAMYSGGSPTLQWNLLLPSSGSKSEPSKISDRKKQSAEMYAFFSLVLSLSSSSTLTIKAARSSQNPR